MGLRYRLHTGLLAALLSLPAVAQTPAPEASLPNAPSAAAPTPRQRLQLSVAEKDAARLRHLAIVNYRPYDKPTHKDQFIDYLNDSYGLPALGRSLIRASYGEYRGKPTAWGTDFPGFMQRYGSAMGANAISGNVRYGMETVFHEDMRYIPCHGCRVKHKIENVLLAEITARHDVDGHRFFTLTPVVSDFSGPIIANTLWVPSNGPIDGVVAARTLFATRILGHLFTEFVLERRHHDKPEE